MNQPSRTAEYGRHMRRMQAYGRWQPYVDAEPARQHVLALRAVGMGPKRIAEVSGVPHGSLAKLVYGDPQRGLAPSKRIRPETEARILAVAADPFPASTVDGTGTHRRLRALVALGWSLSYLSRRLGTTGSNGWKVIHLDRAVYASTREATLALYAELSMTPAPADTPLQRRHADQARAIAARNGWVPPLAWDEEDIDDPAARPRARVSPQHRRPA